MIDNCLPVKSEVFHLLKHCLIVNFGLREAIFANEIIKVPLAFEFVFMVIDLCSFHSDSIEVMLDVHVLVRLHIVLKAQVPHKNST